MIVEEPADVARLREAFASWNEEGPHHSVEAERVFDALHGLGTAEERQSVVAELLVNPAAAQAWRLARDIAADAAPRAWKVPATWTWTSLASAAVLVLTVGWQVISPLPAEEPVYRRVDARTIASALPPGAVLARTNPVLRWTGIDGAKYRVTVFTTDLDVIEESAESLAREHTLSQDTLTRVRPGAQILWQVEARLAGEGVVVSPTFSTRVP